MQGLRVLFVRDVVPSVLVDIMSTESVAYGFIVPAVLRMMLKEPGIADADFSALRCILYGASPIGEDLLREVQAHFACDLIQLYGMTETSGAGTWLPPADHDPARGKLRSCGIEAHGVEIRVWADDRAAAASEVGEVQIRSGAVVRQYWKRPDATTAAFTDDGWFRTGDLGYFDDERYLYIHDRLKDMIVTGAENVYPAEVEHALQTHPDVLEAAVIAVPDEKWGEAVKAIIVLRPGSQIGEAELIAHARGKIAGYKCPKTVDIVDEMPHSASGKILRYKLREPYWQGETRRVR